jgi:hypothetical protein
VSIARSAPDLDAGLSARALAWFYAFDPPRSAPISETTK